MNRNRFRLRLHYDATGRDVYFNVDSRLKHAGMTKSLIGGHPSSPSYFVKTTKDLGLRRDRLAGPTNYIMSPFGFLHRQAFA